MRWRNGCSRLGVDAVQRRFESAHDRAPGLGEADRPADQIVVLDSATVIAEGTPEELQDWAGGERLEVVLPEREDRHATAAVIGGVSDGAVLIEEEKRRVTLPATVAWALLILSVFVPVAVARLRKPERQVRAARAGT